MTNSAQIHGIKFQPIPKRFMVWDTKENKFLGKQGWIIVPTLPDCGVTLPYENIHNPDNIDEDCIDWADADLLTGRYIICQSTNLFDKDGKEIFEGNIVNVYECFNFGSGDNERDFDGVVVCHEGCWSVNSWNGENEIMQPLYEILPEHITLTGHTLSNPGLMEEKDV